MANTDELETDHPKHADVWRSPTGIPFVVTHVCGHHDPPHVTGYWCDDEGAVDPHRHAVFSLPTFLDRFVLVEREQMSMSFGQQLSSEIAGLNRTAEENDRQLERLRHGTETP